ncbi:MAG: 1-acyl-sn-glycerol-3-phosphate acyltransferase [Acidimicrobiia bacterium]
MQHTLKRSDRIIKRLVSWMVAGFYHRVEVRQPHDLTASGPQLANASHFGGFVDPVLLIYSMDRVPRFIARDVIWKIPPARWVMNWVGAIPVHKPEDKGARTSNDQMFASTYTALHDGQLVCIFPEGITVDDPQIAAIKTGSARIALGARANGVEGIRLLSAGIHYQNKAALRSDVFVNIGWEIDLDANIDQYVEPGSAADASNHAAVKKLTGAMETNLRLAAPDFEDWTTARSLTNAATVALRLDDSEDLDVGLAERERLAAMLDDSADAQSVEDAMETYQADLDALGMDDRAYVGGLNRYSVFSWYLIKTLVIGLLLLPFALVGLFINAIPMAIVWLIGRAKVADAMMATIKPMGALLAFVITWSVVLWWVFANLGVEAMAAVLILLPVYLFALIAWFERLVLLGRAIRGFAKSRSAKDVFDQVAEHRRAVVESVAQAV